MVDEEEQARFMKEKADVACARAVAVCTSPLVPKQVLLRADSGFFRSESWAFDSRIDFGAAKEQVRGLDLEAVRCLERYVLPTLRPEVAREEITRMLEVVIQLRDWGLGMQAASGIADLARLASEIQTEQLQKHLLGEEHSKAEANGSKKESYSSC